MTPSLILINPWIYDFAAYDLWSKPLGLLYLAGYLRHCGFTIHLIDCLDVHHPGMRVHSALKMPKRRSYGTGKFWRQEVPKPEPLKHIPRSYCRYGISPKLFEDGLSRIKEPAAILVTSLMTYWYPGVKAVVSLAKKIHPGVPVILGGIYAKLCRDHALQTTGADCVITDSDPMALLKVLNSYGVPKPGTPPDPGDRPYPAFDLLRRIDYVCLLTSIGCPFRCQYCASSFLVPHPTRRAPVEVLEEILFWHTKFGIRDFAFYDDALLVSAETHFMLLLESLTRLQVDLRFHTPNAVHVKEVTPKIARLMYQIGFRTIRLGLETSESSLHRQLDNKMGKGDFERAVQNLHKAGFTRNEIGTYLLMGLPGQSVQSVMEAISFVSKTGAIPFLSEYSPIPHTRLWSEATGCSEYDLSSEPLFHNNTLLPCWDDSQRKELPQLKRRVSEIRQVHR
jgi:radical SAM superfamily enzyme YgiQ (UPF0313 family)